MLNFILFNLNKVNNGENFNQLIFLLILINIILISKQVQIIINGNIQQCTIIKSFILSSLVFIGIDLIFNYKLNIAHYSYDWINISLIILIFIDYFLIFVWYPKDFPPFELEKPDLKKIKRKKIKVGAIIHKKKILKDLSLDLDDLQRHILIYGQTGSGKSTFSKNLIFNITKKYPEYPILIFEFKEEYTEDRIWEKLGFNFLYPGKNFFINPFEPDIFNIDIYPEVLFQTLKNCKLSNETDDFSPQMEKVLVESISNVIKKKVENKSDNKKNNQNIDEQNLWKDLFNELRKYELKNRNKIPQIQQTVISIQNRLRRYESGALKNLFNFTKKNTLISELLNGKYIIELGEILKFGGDKEDLVFFSNMILKTIWEKNIKSSSTKKLRHITVFEDISYIASKKLIEKSKLTSYLEDITLLLRGKGEALISIASSLDISKNIVHNTGNKFFFKSNEKTEDIEHYLGLYNSEINFNQLQTGFCIAKIDSIPFPFLIKIPYKNKNITINFFKLFRKKRVKNFQYSKEITNSKDSIKFKEITSMLIRNNDIYKNEISTKFNNFKKAQDSRSLKRIKEKKSSFRIDKRNLEEYLMIWYSDFKIINNLFILRNFSKIPKLLYSLITKIETEIEKINFNENDLLKKKIIIKIKDLKNRMKDKVILEKNLNSEIIYYLIKEMADIFYKLKEEIHLIHKINKEFIKEKNKNKNYYIKEYKENEKKNLTLQLNYFDEIIGPMNYFEIGDVFVSDKITNKYLRELDFNDNFREIKNISDSHFFINFEIPSKWSRAKTELLQITITFNPKIDDLSFKKKKIISRNIYEEIINFFNNKELFYGFYLTNKEKMATRRDIIVKKSIEIKEFLKKTINKNSKINTIKEKNSLNITIQDQEINKLESLIQSLL